MPRRRLAFTTWPAAVYAIGDVHGCLSQLLALEKQIIADRDRISGEKWIINLGDYIDRGPDSNGVISHLQKPLPPDWKRFCLVGNHEQMLLDFLTDPSVHEYWLDEGGPATMRSYGVDPDTDVSLGEALERAMPVEHLEFLRDLPIGLSLPGWYFVHAGLRPGVPLASQTDEDMMLIRNPFLQATAPHEGMRVVHGHTPGREPVVTPARIGIDTHCYRSGRLTALRVLPDGGQKFFTAAG